ncbi:hypothetical protein ACEQPO_26155 [Bacillus sp. SL00103]
MRKIKKSKTNLPSQTVYHEIKGGTMLSLACTVNKKGDQPANIPALTQQKEIIQTMLEWLPPAKKLPNWSFSFLLFSSLLKTLQHLLQPG